MIKIYLLFQHYNPWFIEKPYSLLQSWHLYASWFPYQAHGTRLEISKSQWFLNWVSSEHRQSLSFLVLVLNFNFARIGKCLAGHLGLRRTGETSSQKGEDKAHPLRVKSLLCFFSLIYLRANYWVFLCLNSLIYKMEWNMNHRTIVKNKFVMSKCRNCADCIQELLFFIPCAHRKKVLTLSFHTCQNTTLHLW